MFRLTRSEVAAYAVCALLVAVLGWRALRSGDHAAASRPAVKGPPAATVSRPSTAGMSVVHVVGEVRRPGVYQVRTGARVEDAIAKAGGATSAADLQGVNLAAKVSDAQQVVVPRVAAQRSGSGDATVGGTAAGGTGAGAASGPVNLNTATAAELDALDGVGPSTAQKILELRAQRGGFRSVDDLSEVPGIGPKRLASLRAQVGT
jgi:competence protein ComEA